MGRVLWYKVGGTPGQVRVLRVLARVLLLGQVIETPHRLWYGLAVGVEQGYEFLCDVVPQEAAHPVINLLLAGSGDCGRLVDTEQVTSVPKHGHDTHLLTVVELHEQAHGVGSVVGEVQDGPEYVPDASSE